MVGSTPEICLLITKRLIAPKNHSLSFWIGPPRSECHSQNFRFGCPVKPRDLVASSTLLPTQDAGSSVMLFSDLNWLPPLLMVETTAAPGVFISTSPPPALTATSSFA